jgi:predicted O-methyltransferase YrrM
MNLDKALKISGWMSEKELEFLAQLASTSALTVEVGAHRGRSTRAMADNTDGVIYVIDPWVKDYFYDDGRLVPERMDVFPEFCDNLEDHIHLSHKVVPIKKYSDEVLSDELPEKVNVFFIDGDHRYNQVMSDIKLAMRMTSGIIAGHDYTHEHWPGVREAVGNSFETINIVDSIWWTSWNQ